MKDQFYGFDIEGNLQDFHTLGVRIPPLYLYCIKFKESVSLFFARLLISVSHLCKESEFRLRYPSFCACLCGLMTVVRLE